MFLATAFLDMGTENKIPIATWRLPKKVNLGPCFVSECRNSIIPDGFVVDHKMMTIRQYRLTTQYSPKIVHTQEVAQEVLAPQEHASGEKNFFFFFLSERAFFLGGGGEVCTLFFF